MKIADVYCKCKSCDWAGIVEDCDSGPEGELLCPTCQVEVLVVIGNRGSFSAAPETTEKGQSIKTLVHDNGPTTAEIEKAQAIKTKWRYGQDECGCFADELCSTHAAIAEAIHEARTAALDEAVQVARARASEMTLHWQAGIVAEAIAAAILALKDKP